MLPRAHGPWTLTEVPIPIPGPKEVLVKNIASGLNPIDWKIRDTGRFVTTYPIVLGGEASGTILSIGNNVKRFQSGDRV